MTTISGVDYRVMTAVRVRSSTAGLDPLADEASRTPSRSHPAR